MEFSHKSVLLKEAVSALNVKPDGIYVDGTAGGGGHSAEILKHLTTGKLISIDQDPDAIETVTKRFENEKCSIVVQSNFSQMKSIVNNLGYSGVDGVLLDLGVSSHQLDDAERGFSYHKDAPLDMRMSQKGRTAAEIVNDSSVKELTDILIKYGEEKFAYRIAREIARRREEAPIVTTLQLASAVKAAYPAAARRDGHPARKTFQAIRIAVNGELDILSDSLQSAFDILNKDGRLAVITFHSLEDRIVKHKMSEWCKGCVCPPDFPVCVCGRKPKAHLTIKKSIEPSKSEIEEN